MSPCSRSPWWRGFPCCVAEGIQTYTWCHLEKGHSLRPIAWDLRHSRKHLKGSFVDFKRESCNGHIMVVLYYYYIIQTSQAIISWSYIYIYIITFYTHIQRIYIYMFISVNKCDIFLWVFHHDWPGHQLHHMKISEPDDWCLGTSDERHFSRSILIGSPMLKHTKMEIEWIRK